MHHAADGDQEEEVSAGSNINAPLIIFLPGERRSMVNANLQSGRQPPRGGI